MYKNFKPQTFNIYKQDNMAKKASKNVLCSNQRALFIKTNAEKIWYNIIAIKAVKEVAKTK